MMQKLKTKKLVATLVIILTTCNSFAQDIGFGDNVNDNNTAPVASIDSDLWIVLAVACVYAGYKYSLFYKKQKVNRVL